MSVETEQDLKGLRRVGEAVAEAIRRMRAAVRPGITTRELDAIGAEALARHGARSAPNLVYDFPGTNCISVNEEAVHGIPSERQLREGDLVTLDVTAELDGYYADAADTVGVGELSPLAQRLRDCAESAFWKGAGAARAGRPLWEIGAAVEAEVRRAGFRVLRDLCGHGIGRTIHEAPSVLNYPERRGSPRLTDGLVITIEPIISATTERTVVAADKWTVRSRDGSLTAHYEHTIVVGRGEPLILTAA